MNKKEIDEIIEYINTKYNENVPSLAKIVIRKKAKKIETINVKDLPTSLRNCTLEELILIVKGALKQGKIKF